MRLTSLAMGLASMLAAPVAADVDYGAQLKDGDYIARDFRFVSGETMPQLRLHYATLGSPKRDAYGRTTNAVLIIHGTGGTGRQFLQPQFAQQLFGPGQPLDAAKYYIILVDAIGHGQSSKPSDGLRMKFPKYDYADMVEAQRLLITRHLGVDRLRLIFGTSMGCMHAFVWGEAHPEMVQAMMPMACNPVELAGLNRMWRRLTINAIEKDPAWNGGNYTKQPEQGLRTASSISAIVGGAPLYLQKTYPTRETADGYIVDRVEKDILTRDANDYIYQLQASRTYDPAKGSLEKITMPVTWMNSADDFINPRNFTFAEAAVKRMPNARFVLIPETDDTHGHGTHTWAVNWRQELLDLLARSEAK